MNVVITKQDCDAFEARLFADFRFAAPRKLPLSKSNIKKCLRAIGKASCTVLKADYVRVFEDRISPYPELQAWLESQCGKAFSYEETVLQCVLAMEYEAMRRERRASVRYGWDVLRAEVCRLASEEDIVLRAPSYGTFLKRVRALQAVQSACSTI